MIRDEAVDIANDLDIPSAQGTIVAGLPSPTFKHIEVAPISGACGCVISGADLTRPLPAPVLKEVMKAFEHFLVIVFRDQAISPNSIKRSRVISARLPSYLKPPLMVTISTCRKFAARRTREKTSCPRSSTFTQIVLS